MMSFLRGTVAAICIVSSGLSQTATRAQEWDAQLSEMVKLGNAGRYAEARELGQRALQEAEQFGPENVRVAYALNEIGALEQILGRYVPAERAYVRAARILENRPNERIALSNLLNNLGEIYCEFGGRYAKAESVKRRAIELATAEVGPRHPEIGRLLSSLAIVRAQRDDLPGARSLFEQAMELLDQSPATYAAPRASALNSLGVIMIREGNDVEALHYLTRAIDIWSAAAGADHPGIARPLLNLARLYIRMDRASLAIPKLDRAQEIIESKLGPDHPLMGETLASRSHALRKIGDKKQAKAFEQRARDIAWQQPAGALAHSQVHISDLR